MAHHTHQECIDACDICAQECDHCASSCLRKPDVKMLLDCIWLDLDGADICRARPQRWRAEGPRSRPASIPALRYARCAHRNAPATATWSTAGSVRRHAANAPKSAGAWHARRSKAAKSSPSDASCGARPRRTRRAPLGALRQQFHAVDDSAQRPCSRSLKKPGSARSVEHGRSP